MASLIYSFLFRESLTYHYGLSNNCDDVSPKSAIGRKYIELGPLDPRL